MTAPTDALIERLGATEPRVSHIATNRTSPPTSGIYQALVNPDGPEAAALIRSLLARIEAAEKVIAPFAKMGQLLDGPFGPALFKDGDNIGLGGAWSDNGTPRSITFGDLRAAAQWQAGQEGDQHPRPEGERP